MNGAIGGAWSAVRAATMLAVLGAMASCAPPPALQSVASARGLRASAPHASFSTAPWPRRDVLDLALRAYRCGRTRGEIIRPVLTVIDYSLPSTERRLWVIDLVRKRVLFHELVAHGVNSGANEAVAFSNAAGSRQSSLGLFRTDETYTGRHGTSLRLSGLEPGVNDRARERAIVMHGAEYVSDAYAAAHGQLGRSWGCPAVRPAVHATLIDAIRNGSAVFAYYPDAAWLRSSRFLHCGTELAQRNL